MKHINNKMIHLLANVLSFLSSLALFLFPQMKMIPFCQGCRSHMLAESVLSSCPMEAV